MSHRDDCPTTWEARREGERAQNRGYSSYRNPYDQPFDEGCPEAARSWKEGYRSAQLREEEEEQQEERASRRRHEEEVAEQQAYYQMQEEEHYRELERQAAEEVQAGTELEPTDQADSENTKTPELGEASR